MFCYVLLTPGGICCGTGKYLRGSRGKDHGVRAHCVQAICPDLRDRLAGWAPRKGKYRCWKNQQSFHMYPVWRSFPRSPFFNVDGFSGELWDGKKNKVFCVALVVHHMSNIEEGGAGERQPNEVILKLCLFFRHRDETLKFAVEVHKLGSLRFVRSASA